MSSDWLEALHGLALGSRMRRLVDYLTSQVREVYAAEGIEMDPPHFSILTLLHQEGPLPVSAIAERIGMSRATVTKRVKQLESEHLLVRVPSPTGRRRTDISLAPQGQQQVQQARPAWIAIGAVVNRRLENLNGSFWDVLAEAETHLTEPPLAPEVLAYMHGEEVEAD